MKKALLVEDDPELLALMAGALEEMNLDHLTATSAEAALATMLTAKHEIDLVCL